VIRFALRNPAVDTTRFVVTQQSQPARAAVEPLRFRTPRREFVTAEPSPKGPTSNTGLNPHPLKTDRFSCSVDYCTLVFSQDNAAAMGQTTRTIVGWLFGGLFTVTELRSKMWQFYRSSAYIRDSQGDVVGRIGCDGNGDTWCVSLTGAGCQQIRDWAYTYHQALFLDAHLSRVDIAFDDFDGQIFDSIHRVDTLARDKAFAPEGAGRAPRTHFIDDHGSNKGCTVYVGSKGRKELCVYEKGKQLGDEASPWIRCELRVWRSNGLIPLDALIRCQSVLMGAYDVLRDMLPIDAEGSRPETIKRDVAATAVAATRFLREQCGPLLNLFWTALGDDATWFMKSKVCRQGIPARFRGKGLNPAALAAMLRQELAPDVDPPF
jgi:phage replication initiation protein